MKKLFKYLAIGILIIIGLFVFIINFGENVVEKDVNNFVSDPNIKIKTLETIKRLETNTEDRLKSSKYLDSFITKLENKYPNNSEVKSLRNSFDKALVLQNEKKNLEEREKKLAKQKEQQTVNNKKQIAMSAICNTNAEIGTYMSGMESLKTSEAVEYIKNNNNCYLAVNAKSNSDIFTKGNSTIMQKGRYYLVLFNGKKYGATTIDAYENP